MFQVNLTSKVPIYEQLSGKIMELMMKNVLHENDQLPSVRALAKELGINPNTVQKAYQELEHNGVIYSVVGRGSFIAPLKDTSLKDKAMKNFDESVLDAFSKGLLKEDLINRIEVIANDRI
jgi:GntR family transcriptional regulator